MNSKREEKKKLLKARDSYGLIYERVKNSLRDPSQQHRHAKNLNELTDSSGALTINEDRNSNALVPVQNTRTNGSEHHYMVGSQLTTGHEQLQLQPKKAPTIPKPKWHAPWKLYRVISGHLGWVRCVAVEPGNEWFATGAADRVIKIWDLASGKLKLSLTGK